MSTKKGNGPAPEKDRGAFTAFAERIRLISEEFGGPYPLSKKAGFSSGAMSKWLTGDSEPGLYKIVSLAEAAGVRFEWLATGQGPMREGEEDVSGEKDDYVLVPLYDAKVGAGPGTLVEGEREVAKLAFLKKWIKQKGLSLTSLALVIVYGESMEPTFSNGDVALVELGNGELVRDGLYVLRVDDRLMVKRLQLFPGNRIRATSDNPRYEPFEIDLAREGDQVKVIGRVVWIGREV